MRDANHRDAVFYDLVVQSDPDHAPVWPLADLLTKITILFERKATAYWRDGKMKKIFLSHIFQNHLKSCAVLLIYCTNGNTPDGTFTHLETDEERVIEKDDAEGRPESIHLILSSIGSSANPNRYLTIIEGGDVLNRQLVEDYLNHLLRRVAQAEPRAFSCPHPDGHTDAAGHLKQYRYHNVVRLQGHVADSFQEDLKAGRLTGVALESDGGTRIGFADGKFVKAHRTTIKLSPQTTWKDKATDLLKESMGLARQHGFDKVRVSFTSSDRMPHLVDSTL
jgi:hypothetical protein